MAGWTTHSRCWPYLSSPAPYSSASSSASGTNDVAHALACRGELQFAVSSRSYMPAQNCRLKPTAARSSVRHVHVAIVSDQVQLRRHMSHGSPRETPVDRAAAAKGCRACRRKIPPPGPPRRLVRRPIPSIADTARASRFVQRQGDNPPPSGTYSRVLPSVQARQPQPVRPEHVDQRAQHALVGRVKVAYQFLLRKSACGLHQQPARPGCVTDVRTQNLRRHNQVTLLKSVASNP